MPASPATTNFQSIREFCNAVIDPFSYNPFTNIYLWFGLFWGMPVPLVTITIEHHYLTQADASASLLETLGSPIQWIFLAHPLLFGLLFGILGTIRFRKEQMLQDVITEHQEVIHKLKETSTLDPLTGLKNRRYFAHNFYDECARSLRRQESISLLFLDIDHFKQVNDHHGHHLGDVVLKEIATFVKQQCRPYDMAVRWGGEEFVVLLRGTDEDAAKGFAERIRRGIESGAPLSVSFPVTISIGLCQYQVDDTLESLVDRADQALYQAKQTGRNKVVSRRSMNAESS